MERSSCRFMCTLLRIRLMIESCRLQNAAQNKTRPRNILLSRRRVDCHLLPTKRPSPTNCRNGNSSPAQFVLLNADSPEKGNGLQCKEIMLNIAKSGSIVKRKPQAGCIDFRFYCASLNAPRQRAATAARGNTARPYAADPSFLPPENEL